MCSQRKKDKEVEEEEYEIVQPEWVVDHETFNLWEPGVAADSLPEDVKLTSETKAQLWRLREWAKAEMKQRRQVERQAEPQPQPAAATVTATATATATATDAHANQPRSPFVPDAALLAKAAALASGPRVGVSPVTVMQ